ncbi:hypothetical protein CNMCM5623_008145 [Aspergillus felis]|uniref:NACHT domain-containing protein n=1 Tax=Aspergillus felis TaxID=1287682 RepID=A0A8H6PJE9_9EURO|nr:hypothetical protein CNMCM5623_008145 [Aspergillus felis]
MEGPIANASKLKPEIRLVQALADFKAVLSTDRRARFDESIAAFKDRLPDANDVNRLTAEINRDIQQTTRRCYGPRFVHVLQAVQQYATIGDVLIGGSQNLVASGVWAAVRLTLTMLTQSASYLEKMSTLFMNAGRSAPRYQDMALLYPRSKRLRDALCEYFIVILNICKHAVKFLQKSTLSQFSSALSDSSLASFEKELQQWSVVIVEEVALLSSQSVQEEAKENSRFRQIMVKFSGASNQRQQLALRIRLLDACSTYDYQTSWKQARKQGTTTWFTRTCEYQKWKETPSSCSLFCTGKLGSGKTTLLANMVDDLFFSTPSGSTAYFFCRFDVSESLTARTIIGCLARQLLGQQPIDLTKIDNFFENSLASQDEQIILDFLRELLPVDPIYSLIVDGLDECPEIERQTTLEMLQHLQNHFKVRTCLSFRQDAGDHAKVAAAILNRKWTLLIPENNPDIEAYIDAELHERLESCMLCIGDPAIILPIQHALVNGAQGMFLWATLLLDCICMEQTDGAILQALESLPQSLSETFTRVLQQASASNTWHRHRIVQLVMAARRPLSVKQLCEALSVIPGDTTWDPGRQINNIHAALASCKCLIITDEEEQTVRFAHHSIKHFFIDQGDEPENPNPIDPDEANKEMGRVILTYLNYGIFDRQVSHTVLPKIPAADAPARIVSTVFGDSVNTKRIALELLKTRKKSKRDIGQTLAEAAMAQRKSPAETHPFLVYAKKYYRYHIQGVWNCDKEMGRLWECLLANKALDLQITGWLQYEMQQRRVTGPDGDFIPRDVMDQLFHYMIIHKVLAENGFDELEAAELAPNIYFGHLEWFAMLVAIGAVSFTRALFRALIKDPDLHISRVQFLEKFKSTVLPAAQPESKQSSTPPSVGSMDTDSLEKLVGMFCLRQREYFAPILHKGGQYTSEDGVMPFLPLGSTTHCDEDSILALVHPAHHDFPYRGTKNIDAGYQVALKSLNIDAIGPDNQFLMSLEWSKVDHFHLLQAIASYRPRKQDGTPQPIHLIFPLSGANLDDFWRQSLIITEQVQSLLGWSLAQMAGLAEALDFVIRNDPKEQYISLRQVTPCNIQWFRHPSFGSHGWGALHLDLRTLMIGQSRASDRHVQEAYRAPHEGHIRKVIPVEHAQGVHLLEYHYIWSLGCIYFEFLIWAVMRSTNLQKFREARGGANAPFYSTTFSGRYQGFKLSPEVSRWAAMLLNVPELSPEVPRFCEYLLQHVLVVDPSARVSARQLASDLEDFRNLQKRGLGKNEAMDWIWEEIMR